VEDKSLSSSGNGSSYQERALQTDDEDKEEELSQKRKHYLKQRYYLQKVSVDGSNSHHSHALSSKSSNREKTKQNDTPRTSQTENVRRPEKYTGTPVSHQQIPDVSKTTKLDTPSKYGMFLKDALFLEVPELLKAQMKVTIDKKLFQTIKFYESPEDVWNVAGYVFNDIKMNGTSIRDESERTLVWSATCALILFCTSELWRQAFERYYASCGKQFLYDLSRKILISNIFSLESFWQKHGSKTSHFWKLTNC